MAIVTRRRDDKFAIIPNAIADDSRLSFEARGVLCYLLAKPNNWSVNVAAIQKAGRIGRDKVYRILKELIEAGYLRRDTVRDASHRVQEVAYTVFDEAQPLPENQEVEVLEPLPDFPDTEKPDTENTEAYKELSTTKNTKAKRTEGARERARPPGLSKSRGWKAGKPANVDNGDMVQALQEVLGT